MRDDLKKTNICIVGAGAIAEHGHLPAAALHEQASITMLVDKNLDNAKKLASKFEVPNVSTDIADIAEKADAAIIATPPGTHAEIVKTLSKAGIHCLVEKPFARSVKEVDEMASATAEAGTVLSVAMVRRFYPADQFIKSMMATLPFGPVRRITAENGYPFAWPSASPFVLFREQAGGGVLMGLGSHVLDTIFSWIGRPDSVDFESDGLEMDSDSKLALSYPDGCVANIELSRTRLLDNSFVIEFESAKIEAPFLGDQVRLSVGESEFLIDGTVSNTIPDYIPRHYADYHDLPMVLQLDNFLRSIQLGARPTVTAEDIRDSIEIIESCYQVAKPWVHPWSLPIQPHNT